MHNSLNPLRSITFPFNFCASCPLKRRVVSRVLGGWRLDAHQKGTQCHLCPVSCRPGTSWRIRIRGSLHRESLLRKLRVIPAYKTLVDTYQKKCEPFVSEAAVCTSRVCPNQISHAIVPPWWPFVGHCEREGQGQIKFGDGPAV